ncbi:endothelial zinc finger protein induced by tumor necrosis factor alpha-like [Simochromis diagramma]|uniref:endothelial zinc finger protein induced by tumor necrosis factor alpha-like n=1 Tax=Simochromis diagramma TaxID=43689 RepID=UPI001A7E3581|nr:endothelial zinc finger protein induced by tumor necrosis factor alpha-like [Simochromis diagramma]XP_039859789.1 endothelial zinc finger protein induced by tumor necrosis factor alpha-like [Simochromis diagramma]
MEPPAEEKQLFLLGAAGEEERRKEVGCQWESPEEDRKEVGCQSEAAERRDAAVQVDLLSQQLSWRHSGSSAMLLQCIAVRADGPDGGALLQHCTTNRTRTRIIRPAPKLSDEPTPAKSRTQRRRLVPQSSNTDKQSRRRRRHESSDTDQQEEAEVMTVEEDVTADPTWTPSEGGVALQPLPAAPGALPTDSQDVAAVKLELDSTVCDVCGKVMKNKSSLARHSFIHTGKKPFACHLCELRFNRRDNLQHHLNRLHPDGVAKREKQRQVQAWLCAVCGKTFSCRSRLKTHEVIHSGVKPHSCDLCPKAYMRANDLEHHKKVVHVDGTAEPPRPSSLLCDFCGKEFKCRSQLAVHFQTHTGERPHLCDICGRKFARQYQLKRHKVLVHSNHVNGEDSPPDAPFACGVCGKRLKSEALLTAHARIHTGDKPHRCGVCLRSFQRATCLKQHQVRVHLRVRAGDASASRRRSTATSEKAFPCTVCSKVFKFRSLLASHSTIHSDARPFACDFCSRRFRRLSHLKRHREVVHANGARLPQSFVCHICGKDKKCRSQLARHVIIHTGERPFACDLCSARFNRHGNLQQHKKRMHGVGTPPDEEAPPILFDDDAVLTYKQEETVVDCAAELSEDDMDAAQQLDAT